MQEVEENALKKQRRKSWLPDSSAGEEDDSFEFLVIEEIIKRPKTSILSEWIWIQVRIVTVGERKKERVVRIKEGG